MEWCRMRNSETLGQNNKKYADIGICFLYVNSMENVESIWDSMYEFVFVLKFVK